MWSGASRSAPIKARTDRTNPSVWRKGKPKTSRRTNAVSIATSEHRFCPPGRPEGDGRHASVASAESHRVTSPHWTSARSYSRQFPTRYVVLYFGDTLDFISRIVRRPRQQDQPVDDARRSEGQEPCTKACAGKARSRGTRCRDVIFETLFETLWVSNPIRPRSAASRNRVMRGPGVTQGAKRSQGARRPRN